MKKDYHTASKRTSRGAAVGVIICLLLLPVVCAAMFLMHYFPVRHMGIINKYSERYNLEPAFVCAVINAESRFNEKAVSGAGASGLMQLMEDTANWIAPMAGLDDFDYGQIFDPETNIRLGCFYLNMYHERFGTLDNALCAYNAGGGSVEGWLNNPEYSSDGITLDVIPYPETRRYVENVNNYTKIYRIILNFLI